MLERCLKRLEWDKVRAREAQEAADEAERERLAMMSVSGPLPRAACSGLRAC